MLLGLALLWMLVLTVYDVRQRRLPNRLTVLGFVVVMLAAVGSGRGWAATVGAIGLAAVYLLVHLLAPAGMGAGDVKLALGLGALTGCFGADAWALAAIGAPLLTVVVGVVARVGWSRRAVPHGPSMCVASAAAVGLAQW
jgi:leader peptidase (prepilin peptidase) / N-methyltransferase